MSEEYSATYMADFDFEEASDSEIKTLINKDFNNAESARQPREDLWREWYKIYRAYIENKSHGSNLFIPYAFQTIETIVPRIVGTLFSTRPYIGVLPLNKNAIESAKSLENLIDYQLCQQMSFKAVAASWIKEALIYGTSILKTGWEYEEDEVVTPEPVAQFLGFTIGTHLVRRVQTTKDQPLIEHIDLWDFYVDPHATGIDDAEFVIHKSYRTLKYLRKMEEMDIYENIDDLESNLMSEAYKTGRTERMSEIGIQQLDQPTEDKIEVLEYWKDDRVVVLANREVVIRNIENPFFHRKKPFIRLVDTPVPHEFYGIGEIEPIEHLQHELNSIRNQRMDNLNLVVNRMWKVLRGADIDYKQLVSRVGGIVEVDDMADLEPLDLQQVDYTSYQEVEAIQKDIDRTTGSYNYARGEEADRRETATTASILAQSANERFDLKNELMEDMGLKRLGQFLIQLNQQFIDEHKVIRIQGEEGMHFQEIPPEEIRGSFDTMPLGSSISPAVNKEARLNNLINLYNHLRESPYIHHPKMIKKILEAAEIKDVDSLLVEDAEEMLMEQMFGDITEEEVMAMGGQDPAQAPDMERMGMEGVMENERG